MTNTLDLEELKRLAEQCGVKEKEFLPRDFRHGLLAVERDYAVAACNSLTALIAEVERLRVIEKLWATAVAQP